MAGKRTREEDVAPPMESIDGLLYSPMTDLPFGKRIRLGQRDHVIFQSSVEQGYQMGILAHLNFAESHGLTEPIMLDQKQFSMVIKHLLPEGLSRYDRGLWCAHFIAGWAALYLGSVSQEEVDQLLEEEE